MNSVHLPVKEEEVEAILARLPARRRKTYDGVSNESAACYIDKMDFSKIKSKITQKDPCIAHLWTLEETDKAILYYKHFLLIHKKYVEQYRYIPPSIEIDEIWHHHILDTMQYHKDCINIFGCYFHHFPYFGRRGKEDKKNLVAAFNITQFLHHKEFGDYIYQIYEHK